MTRPDKAEVALKYPDQLATFEPSAPFSAHLHALWANSWKSAAMVTLGGTGLVGVVMLVGWLMERLAG